MVRECRPPAREPMSSWLARRSTMATSTPANANSPANISPVGPPPTITTACSDIRICPLRRTGLGQAFYGMTEVLKQVPYAPHIKRGRVVFCFPVISAGESYGRKSLSRVLERWRTCSSAPATPATRP
jgi:hypothetical protein